MPNLSYAALIADVAGSRHIPDRADFQRRLRADLEDVSERFGRDLTGRIELLRGDEIQALFERPSRVVSLLQTLAERLHPVRLHCGFGYGEVTTDLLANPAQMDGPCFHRARSALESAERRDSWLVTEGFGAGSDLAVSALFRLMGQLRRQWTSRQSQIVGLARQRAQKDVAAELGVSPSVVSESLKASSFSAILEGEQSVVALLSDFDPVGENNVR